MLQGDILVPFSFHSPILYFSSTKRYLYKMCYLCLKDALFLSPPFDSEKEREREKKSTFESTISTLAHCNAATFRSFSTKDRNVEKEWKKDIFVSNLVQISLFVRYFSFLRCLKTYFLQQKTIPGCEKLGGEQTAERQKERKKFYHRLFASFFFRKIPISWGIYYYWMLRYLKKPCGYFQTSTL